MPSYRCIVATPTRELFLGEIEQAIVPSAEGDMGILAGHENFVGLNRGGLVTLTLEGGKEKKQILVRGGFTQMMNDHLAILPRFGHKIEDITLEHAEAQTAKLSEELKALEAKGDEHDDPEIESLQARLDWYATQIKYFKGEVA